MNSKYNFFVRVDIVGPYLPNLSQLIADFKFIQENLPQEGWETIPEAPKTSPSSNDSGLSINLNFKTENASEFVFKVLCEFPSSKIAYEKAEQQAKYFCSLLSISVIGCRYFYKIKEIAMIPTNTVTHNTESPPSSSTFGISYEKKSIVESQVVYVQKMGQSLKSDSLLKTCIEYFSKALDAEVMNSSLDEKAILLYFKVIELISNKFIKNSAVSKVDKQKRYNAIINELTSGLKKQITFEEKLKRVRKSFSEIRIIDQSILSENIKNAAKIFGFSQEGLNRLDKVITLRNKKLVHPETDFEIVLEDNRDFREVAKIFIKEYAKRFLEIDNSLIDKIPQVKEVGGWYRYTYKKSS